jgi:hypothetical protein
LSDGTIGFLDLNKIPEAGIKFLVSNYMDVKCVTNDSEALINLRLLLDIANVEVNEAAQTWKCDKLGLSGNVHELTDGPSDAALSLLLQDHINGYATTGKRARIDDGTGLDLRFGSTPGHSGESNPAKKICGPWNPNLQLRNQHPWSQGKSFVAALYSGVDYSDGSRTRSGTTTPTEPSELLPTTVEDKIDNKIFKL